VGHHGDFWPGNAYVDDDTVQVIDFEGFREGLPYEDPSYFLAQLQLFYAYPFMGSEYGALAATFREGYLEGGEFDEAAAEVCRVAKALQILARSEGGASPAGLRGWWRRRTLYAGALGRRA
jgi:Ser/Thr protein kinase RdoA (MazF antagonist)